VCVCALCKHDAYSFRLNVNMHLLTSLARKHSVFRKMNKNRPFIIN